MARPPSKPAARSAAAKAAPKAAPKPAAPKTPPPPRRSHAGRIAAAAIGIAGATGLGVGLNHTEPPAPTPAVSARVLPDQDKTPGALDPAVTDAAVLCAKTWKQGPPGSPPVQGGSLTYSEAGRQTSEALKNQVFVRYSLTNPHDGGVSYEIDHRLPLSLGGRDEIENLWPQSRTNTPTMNAWVKDRLEDRLFNLVCHPKPGQSVTLQQAQAVFLGDWTKGYDVYCNDSVCPAHGTENDTPAS